MRYAIIILLSPVVAVGFGKLWAGSYYSGRLGRDVVFGLVLGLILSVAVALIRSRASERERQRRLGEL